MNEGGGGGENFPPSFSNQFFLDLFFNIIRINTFL